MPVEIAIAVEPVDASVPVRFSWELSCGFPHAEPWKHGGKDVNNGCLVGYRVSPPPFRKILCGTPRETILWVCP